MFSYILILIHTQISDTFSNIFDKYDQSKTGAFITRFTTTREKWIQVRISKKLIHRYELILKNKCCVDKLFVIKK